MKRAARDNPSAAEERIVPLFDRILFYLLLAVLCARPLIGESYERIELGFLAALPPAQGPTPAATAWLDSLLLAASGLVLARRSRWHANYLVAAAIGLLAAAVCVSWAAAADKLLAGLAGSSLLIGMLAGVALSSLLQTRWMLNLVLAAMLASGVTTAVKCVVQRTSEFAQTKDYWEQEYKPQLLEQGVDLEDPLIINYERRMRSGEATGFLTHANVTGSCLVLWLLVAGGLLAERLRRNTRGAPHRGVRTPTRRTAAQRSAPVIVALLCALLATSLWLTGSLGALVGGLVGVLTLVFLGFSARWSARHARGLLALLCAGYLAVVGVVAACGVAKGTLPHASLAFRWYYWTTAGRAWQDAPLTGLGRGNFATAYMQYKPPQSTEEVRDPHNLWLTLLVELGPLGLAGGLLLSGLCVLAGLRGLDRATPTAEPNPGAATIAARALPVVAGLLLVHALFSGRPLGDRDFALIWMLDVVRNWILAFLVFLWLLFGFERASPRGTGWLAAGLCAGLLAAFVHGLIGFALFTPGGLAVFILCAAAATGVRSFVRPPAATERPARPWTWAVPVAIAIVLALSHVCAVTLRVEGATRQLRHLDTLLRTRPPHDPRVVFGSASGLAARNLGDTSAFRTAVRTMLQISRLPDLDDHRRLEWLNETHERALALVCRHDRDTKNQSLLARVDQEMAGVYDRLGRPDEAQLARQRAAESWDRAVELYPTDPRGRISAGKAWFELWQRSGAPEAARRAGEHFAEAIRIDDCRPPQEVARLRPKERTTVETFLRQLRTSAPASSLPRP